MTYLVLEHGESGGRCVAHEDSVPDLELRGFHVVGPTSNQLRAVTDDEQAALDQAEEQAVAARIDAQAKALEAQSLDPIDPPTGGQPKSASAGRAKKE